jgi:hypothetical protein
LSPSPDGTSSLPRVVFAVAAYGAWLAAWILAAGLGVVVYLLLTGIYWWLGLSPWAFRLFAILLVLALGAGWFVAAAWTEQHLAQAPTPAQLGRRSLRVLGGGALALLLGYLATLVVPPPS